MFSDIEQFIFNQATEVSTSKEVSLTLSTKCNTLRIPLPLPVIFSSKNVSRVHIFFFKYDFSWEKGIQVQTLPKCTFYLIRLSVHVGRLTLISRLEGCEDIHSKKGI